MVTERLTPLDASFLRVESSTAHMHVGWAAVLRPAPGRGLPSFEEVRDHLGSRLGRAPRYRQRLLGVPFGVNDPVWADDDGFDVARHVVRSRRTTLRDLADEALSTPLARDRPLWEVWVGTDLEDGRLGVVGKAHHALVDGVAAVELASLLLDPQTDPDAAEPDGWSPAPAPGPAERLAGGALDRLRDGATLVEGALRLATSPGRLLEVPAVAERTARALGRALATAPASETLHPPGSALRSLGMVRRPLGDLRPLRRRFGCTVNDVVLAASAGALRRLLARRGERPGALKAMVPVSVRDDGHAGELGNRISFLFADLPCHVASPAGRLDAVMTTMSRCKREGQAAAGDAVLDAVRFAPRALHGTLARLVSRPQTFNVVVSNIPGPPLPLWLLGARLEAAYPVVPLAERHALSIGVTSVDGHLCFGLHADRLALGDVDAVSHDLEAALDELLALGPTAVSPRPDRRFSRRSPAATPT